MKKVHQDAISTAESRSALLTTGMKLLYESGFNGTSVDRVLAESSQPKGNFYHYFENKEDFGLNVLDAYAGSLLAKAQKFMADDTHTPAERIRLYFKASAVAFEKHGYRLGCLLGNLSCEMADGKSSFQKRTAMYFAGFRQTVASCIKEGQDDGSIKNKQSPDALAQFLIAAWEGALVCDKATKSGDALKTFFDIALSTIEN